MLKYFKFSHRSLYQNNLKKRLINIQANPLKTGAEDPTHLITQKKKKVLTLWQRVGTPFANIMLLGTAINLFLQTYWYNEYLEFYIKNKDEEISKLESQLTYLEEKSVNENK
ncbi:hypothetical protein K502DRAFT_349177 [Neoconidiobolus thromboides FSU 785]|nr:hypothetical protein K502DRAFT_349177 [Neoconidiobolus thromboides FSU 785]